MTLSATLYVPLGFFVDKPLAEALVACRGDWVCARALVNARVATGESVTRMWRRGAILYVELDEGRFRPVLEAGRTLAMVAPSKATPMFALNVSTPLSWLIYHVYRVYAGLDVTGEKPASPNDYVASLREIGSILVELLDRVKRAQGEISGEVSFKDGPRYAYRVVNEGDSYGIDITLLNPISVKGGSFVHGEYNGCEYVVEFGVIGRNRVGIRGLKLKCSNTVSPDTAANLLVDALLHAASRLFKDAYEELPPPGVRESKVDTRIDYDSIEPDYAKYYQLGAWMKLGLPLRDFEAEGSVPDLIIPGPVSGFGSYMLRYTILGPNGEKIHIGVGGDDTLYLEYKGVKTSVPPGMELTVVEGKGREYVRGLANAIITSDKFVVYTEPGMEKFITYVTLAAFDELRWLDRYQPVSPEDIVFVIIRADGIEVSADKVDTGWKAAIPDETGVYRPVNIASIEDIVELVMKRIMKGRRLQAA